MSRWLRNKWRKSKVQLVRPPLPAEMRGITGCRLDTGVIDYDVGEEVFLTILERGDYRRYVGSGQTVAVCCKTGLVRTDHGTIVFMVFSVYVNGAYVSAYEVYLNPHEAQLVTLLQKVSHQTHLKVLFHDTDQDEVIEFLEIENVFDLDRLIEPVQFVHKNELPGDFPQAQRDFQEMYTIEDLLKM